MRDRAVHPKQSYPTVAMVLCGSAVKKGLFFVRRTIDWDQHCGANAFWRFLPYLIQPRILRGFFLAVFTKGEIHDIGDEPID